MEKVNIKFQILATFDPKEIVIVDTSDWSYIEDLPAIIEVTLPGGTVVKPDYFLKRKVTVYNSKNLGLNCNHDGEYLDLPDGIYHFTVKGSPDSFSTTRQYLKTDSTRLEFDKIIASLDFTCSDFCGDTLKKLERIDTHLEAAESNTRLGFYYEAQKHLFKAQKLISKMKGCKTCV